MKVISVISGLKSCKIIKRINRFTVLIDIEGKKERAWLTNTGRLKEIVYEGNVALCMNLKKPKKLRFVLIGTKTEDERYTIIDTRLQMQCLEIAHSKGMISWLRNYELVMRNVKLGNSRIDYLFQRDNEKYFIEVKSAVLFDGYYAMYPDCPSLRGRRHIEELIEAKKEGNRTGIVFIVAHPLAKAFKPSDEGDPVLSDLIREAYSHGVEVHAIKISLLRDGRIVLEDENLELDLSRRKVSNRKN